MRHAEDPTTGKTKRNDNFIGTRNPDRTRTVIFETVPAGVQTDHQLAELVARYEDALDDGRVPPLYGVARYVSLEQRIFDSKNSYYVALRQSQSGWHEEAHDLTPWIRYLLRTIEDAYADFERQVAAGTYLVGATKRAQARNYILSQAPRRFRLAQIRDALPDVSQATISRRARGAPRRGRTHRRAGTERDVGASGRAWFAVGSPLLLPPGPYGPNRQFCRESHFRPPLRRHSSRSPA